MRRKTNRIGRPGLTQLLDILKGRGYETYGPKVRDHAIQWLPLNSISELPAGWTTETGPASYRLVPDGTDRLFDYWTGLDSLKKILHPAHACVTKIEKSGDGLTILEEKPQAVARAFLGARACDLAAVERLDRVLTGDRYIDEIYRASRASNFFVAVQCTRSAPTCFCASMESGPQAKSGFDIALTEGMGEDGSEFLAEAGSASGAEVLEEMGAPAAPPEWSRQMAEACNRAGAAQTRTLALGEARAVIERSFEHPRWEETARRCLACANCTSVCPTCFCVNFEERSSLDLKSAERHRLWDSCFTLNFSYIHGGSIRLTPKSRYRQWLSHKLARWQDQFNEPGCVGCGRCITACPAGIDITEEFAALHAAPASLTGDSHHGH